MRRAKITVALRRRTRRPLRQRQAKHRELTTAHSGACCPHIAADIRGLREAGFGILVKGASLDALAGFPAPGFDFADWNFGASTEQDYHWSVAALHAEGHQIHVADFTQPGVYACRILAPGLSWPTSAR